MASRVPTSRDLRAARIHHGSAAPEDAAAQQEAETGSGDARDPSWASRSPSSTVRLSSLHGRCRCLPLPPEGPCEPCTMGWSAWTAAGSAVSTALASAQLKAPGAHHQSPWNIRPSPAPANEALRTRQVSNPVRLKAHDRFASWVPHRSSTGMRGRAEVVHSQAKRGCSKWATRVPRPHKQTSRN